MNDPKILVVEDDATVRNLITTTLRSNHYPYITAGNGEAALAAASAQQPDIVFLDLGLPDLDGVEVIKRIRCWSKMPIIVISARSEDADKVAALDAGADDYLTKPFSVTELLARLRVAQRRVAAESKAGDCVFTNGKLTVDYGAGCAFLDGEQLKLTPTEYKLLCLLARDAGKVLTHTYLTQKIWGSSWESDTASLRVHMATLRKKLEKDRQTQYIQTHIGIGYRMLKAE
ncbi:MAG: response regulator transcription factor [Oscillospiraceae bacterium]|nr:response regulator transcription factor [Oscillospiraceae bacterium]